MHKLFLQVCLGLLLSLSVQAKRVALILGNGNYPAKQGSLGDIPLNDARDLSTKLKKLGFEVILRTDSNEKQSLDAIKQFKASLKSGDEALFYYSGHGVSVNNRNCIAPISSRVIPVDSILNVMEEANTSVNIVIIDACRNSATRSAGTTNTFVEQKAATGSYIAFATNPGNTALNTVNQKNSPYTAALLNNIEKMLPVELMFKEVREEVIKTTNGRQTPWEHSSLVGRFQFAQNGSAQQFTEQAQKSAPSSNLFLVDKAAELASKDLIQKLAPFANKYQRIAFLPLENDRFDVSDIISAKLSGAQTQFEIYARDKKEWDKMAQEVNLVADGYDDLFNPETIVKISDIKFQGIQAIVTGKIRQIVAQDGQIRIGFTYRFYDIKTAKTVTSDFVDTVYPQQNTEVATKFDPMIQKAAEDAAYSLGHAFSKELPVKKIALLPFKNDPFKTYELIYGKIIRHQQKYQFYTVDLRDWQDLLQNRDTDGRLNADGRAALKKLTGADAILYGELRGTTQTNTSATVNLTLKLTKIDGQALFMENIDGEYIKPTTKINAVDSIEYEVKKAAEESAIQLAKKLAATVSKKYKVVTFPFEDKGRAFEDILLPELTQETLGTLSFHRLVSNSDNNHILRRISRDLNNYQGGSTDLNYLSSYLVDKKQSNQQLAVFTGRANHRVRLADNSEDPDIYTVSFFGEIRDLQTGEIIWTGRSSHDLKVTKSKYQKTLNKEDEVLERKHSVENKKFDNQFQIEDKKLARQYELEMRQLKTEQEKLALQLDYQKKIAEMERDEKVENFFVDNMMTIILTGAIGFILLIFGFIIVKKSTRVR